MRKHTFLLLFSFLTLILASCSQFPGYRIYGTIKDASYNGKTVYLEDPYDFGKKCDSTTIQNGKFIFSDSLNITSPYLRIIALPTHKSKLAYRLPVVMENGKIVAELGEIVCTSGTEQNDRLQDFLLGIDEFLSSIHNNKEINAEQIEVQFSEFLQKAISTNADNAVGVYIYKSYSSSIFPEHRDILLSRHKQLKEQINE